MDLRMPKRSRHAGRLENGTVIVVCGLPVVISSVGELSPWIADLSTAIAGIASVVGLVLLQLRIGLFHVNSGDIAPVLLLIAGIASWAIAILFAASGGPTISLFVTAVSAAFLLSALRNIVQHTVGDGVS